MTDFYHFPSTAPELPPDGWGQLMTYSAQSKKLVNVFPTALRPDGAMVRGMLQTGHGYIERWEVSEEDDCRRAGGGRLYHQQLDFRFRLPEGEPGEARSRFCWSVGLYVDWLKWSKRYQSKYVNTMVVANITSSRLVIPVNANTPSTLEE